MIYRHWTAAERVPLIMREGVIHPTDSMLSMFNAHSGPDVVWLLPNDVDPGTGQDHGLSDIKRTGWIDVDVPAIKWLDWSWTSTMSEEWRSITIETAGGIEFARQWYVWPAPIRRRHIVGSSEVALQT